MPSRDEEVELEPFAQQRPEMEEEEGTAAAAGPSDEHVNDGEDDELLEHDDDHDDLPKDAAAAMYSPDSALDRRTKRKLDCLLLPFLALLFLLNSVDKSNIGNAETAGFTHDAGLEPHDLNTAMGFFFAFFVALQPVGAALGRKFGMTRYVPTCMSLWGLCTLLHMWVRRKWQLIVLRIAIASLEAGFYPTTVAYLSLFYTRYEFAVRLSVFYGQTAVAGVLGGVLSWAVFSKFEKSRPGEDGTAGWKGWQVLFLIEGCLTMFIALAGFVWLPRSAETAWFFNAQERRWAERRIGLDYENDGQRSSPQARRRKHVRAQHAESEDQEGLSHTHDADENDEAHHHLLGTSSSPPPHHTDTPITADAGLSKHDILSAFLTPKIWHLLAANILSAIPATAFGVFLPLVIKQLSPSLNLRPSQSNLLSAPPFAFGAAMLLTFARWSDASRKRLVPIFWGLALLLVGLTVTLAVPMHSYILRYLALCILLSGAFIASPLTVAWLTNNTPEPGKRAVLLGINGWGNLAGVFLSVLFTPEDKETGYLRPFIITLLCALASLGLYVAFFVLLRRENKWRERVVRGWSQEEIAREARWGDVPVPLTRAGALQRRLGLDGLARRLGLEEGRRGDEKLTFRYGL